MKLYKAQNVAAEQDETDEYTGWRDEDGFGPWTEADGAPEGWDAYCQEKWGEEREFFIPSDRPIYRSRSSAQARVNLINRWGGNAVLVEAEVDWVPVEVANARRRMGRRETRISVLTDELFRLNRVQDADMNRADLS